ncbi:hypothetical protein I1A_002841 [Pseudomonas fluorescens R124]|uniref:Uncharacterized protein n=1 Tax=Pseudomonas fluorescens R124 TaxID=743713 RepID=A0A7U9CN99_PSEFL|nr:hypothetical protein [Pseudomonas fluorescens]EJZ58513.1 hypothetical protein I1A_002841 [Pseudomonas fluorescens R124]
MSHNTEALARKVEQLEGFRAQVQAICESGKHRTIHTQAQMCGFLDGLRFEALKATLDPAPERDDDHADEIEEKARAIYEGWSVKPGFVPWVEGGNSTMQREARAMAQRAMEIAG